MKKIELERLFEFALDKGLLMVGVSVHLPNLNKPEIIINPIDNYIEKIEYYKNAYDDSLVLKNCKDIYITGAYASDYADEIYCELMLQ
jgi:hypothetical protein